MFQVWESSPKAKAKIKSYDDAIGVTHDAPQQTQYPLDKLHIGTSIGIPVAEANEKSLRVLASIKAKRTGKKFAVLKHAELGMIEVARIA